MVGRFSNRTGTSDGDWTAHGIVCVDTVAIWPYLGICTARAVVKLCFHCLAKTAWYHHKTVIQPFTSQSYIFFLTFKATFNSVSAPFDGDIKAPSLCQCWPLVSYLEAPCLCQCYVLELRLHLSEKISSCIHHGSNWLDYCFYLLVRSIVRSGDFVTCIVCIPHHKRYWNWVKVLMATLRHLLKSTSI